jgi:hypothetical protein
MTHRLQGFAIFTTPAGLWLRCFLGIAMTIMVLEAGHLAAAQVDCVQNRRIVAERVAGQVVDPFGVGIPEAKISLSDQAGHQFETRTGPDGKFSLAADAGQYKFEASLPNFQAADVDISLQQGVWNSFHRRDFHVILGLFGMYCPWVTASSRDYENNVRANIKRSKESAQNNAAQK